MTVEANSGGFSWRRPSFRLFQTGAAVILLLLLGIVSAAAHASPTKAEPSDGSVVSVAPKQFTLSFSEPVSPLVLTLIRPDGSSAKLESYKLRDRTLEIEAPADMGDGTHVFAWRIVSEDGHPVGGSVIFSIGAPSAAPPVIAEAADWSVRIGAWLAKVALYIGLFLGIGGVFAAAWMTQNDGSGLRSTLAFVVLGLVATPLSVGFQGLDALSVPLSDITEPAVWQAGLGTTFGRTAVIAVISFGMSLLAMTASGTAARAFSSIAMLGVGTALAASGHASAAEPQWLTRLMVFLHGTGTAFWAGALIPLGAALKRGSPTSFEALRRFSAAIPFVVAILALAGIVLAIIQIETPATLVATAYGNVLLVKLALLGVLFMLAVVNRWKLTAPTSRADAAATRHLVRAIAAETVIIILIFAVASAWRFTPPPRALAIAAAQPASVHIHTAKAMADLEIAPGHAGPVEASIVIMSGDFGPLDAREVTLVLSNPSAGVEPIRRPAQKPGDGTWRVDGVVIPVSGRWTVRIDILISDLEIARLTGGIDIRP